MFKKFIRKLYKSFFHKNTDKRDNNFKKKLKSFLKKNSIENDKKIQTILIWDFGGFDLIFKKNIILSLPLRLKGYNVCFVICDGVSSACIQRGLEKKENFKNWANRCIDCFKKMKLVAEKYNTNYFLASDFITVNEKLKFEEISENVPVQEIINYEYEGIRVGELAWSSINRYMKGFLVDIGDIDKEHEKIYRKYFYAALVNTYISNVVIEKYKPLSIFTSHGVYVDYAPPLMLAFRKKINSISWASGYSNFLHYFTVPKSENRLQLRGISVDEWEKSMNRRLSERETNRLETFIFERYFKAKAKDISVLINPEDSFVLKKMLGIKNNNPIVVLFTHVNWDACFDFSSMIFASANQWVLESIKKMLDIKNVNWIIRIHPGEKIDGSIFTTDDLIKKEFKGLPDNIKIIWSDSEINSYGLYNLVDMGITVFGTVGVELPLFGKNIIVAGDAHYSGKGFTIEPKSKDEYFNLLRNIKNIPKLDEKQIDLAYKYAYSYFIERQIPLTVINKAQGHWGDIDLNKLDQLLPGKDPVIDKICEGIVAGKDVILDEKCFDYLDKIKEELY